MEYINENIAEDVTVNQCSENADLSMQIFIQQFRQYMGYSPYKYIKELRFELAAKVFGNQNQNWFTNTLHEEKERELTNADTVSDGARVQFQKAGSSCVEDLNEIEKIILFLTAAEHEESYIKIYYSEHKKIYDSLINKEFFHANTLEYRKGKKELVKKYSEEYFILISEAMNTCTALSEVYSKVIQKKPLPILLFYSFIRAMAVKGGMTATVLNEYKKCTDCKFLAATLGDVDMIREQIIQEYKDKNIILSSKDIFCLGIGSGRCSEYCSAGSAD
jgi:AraC-like DNA-binding protein